MGEVDPLVIKKVGRLWECKVCWLFGCKVVNDTIINSIVDINRIV